MTRTRIAAVTCAALLLTLAACSSDEDSDPTPDTTTTTEPDSEAAAGGDEAALEQAVRDYTDAYFAPDADAAYDMLSTRCQDSITPAAYRGIVEQAASDYGQLGVETFAVDDLSGDMARVTYTVGLPVIDETLTGQPWVRESSEWRYDAC